MLRARRQSAARVRPSDYAQHIFLEITETAAFTHHDLCDSILREVCVRTGAQLVIDDFGAGHSNLNRLLDLALVRGVHESTKKQAVIHHVSALCHELNARVVAEGIETEPELACVRSLGVDFVQGYLLASPGNPPPELSWPTAGPSSASPPISGNERPPESRAGNQPPPRKRR